MRVQDERGRSNGRAPTGKTEIAVVRMLRNIGFNEQRVAALFGCNQGRISECFKGTAAYEGVKVPWVFATMDDKLEGE